MYYLYLVVSECIYTYLVVVAGWIDDFLNIKVNLQFQIEKNKRIQFMI